MTTPNAAAAELYALLREAELLLSCSSVLSWDEQTGMPSEGAEHRANQAALLAGLIHTRRTAPRVGELIAQLEQSGALAEPDSDLAVNVREARRNYDRATKLPQRLVEELSRTTTLAQQAWVIAKKNSDFAEFLPWLTKMVELKREEAGAVGSPTGVAYDALLDEYEPGMTSERVAAVFSPLRDELVQLVQAIQGSGKLAPIEITERHYPKQSQRVLAEAAARAIGFNFERGRLDESPHPFCSGIGPGDCRLTTRFHDHHFNAAFFGVLHEAGHGIYEQGLPTEYYGLPLGQSVSLGVHESQSRLWENFVGRSVAFWDYLYPTAQQAFPQALGSVPLSDFYAAINDVRPSFIRVEADEVTYNLHIMLRFELEGQLIGGQLAPADLPQAWSSTFAAYLGLTPPKDSVGCLQDVHWSAGLFGYFPTYALGNMYAAQLFRAAERDLGDLPSLFRKGLFKPLKGWLNEHIHQHGKRFAAPRLIERVTGEPLSHRPLVEHLQTKFRPLYGL